MYLVIDNGGTTTKIVLFDRQGTQIARKAFLTKSKSPKVGFYELDLDDLWKNLSTKIKQLLTENNIDSSDVMAVTTVGHGKGLYLLDQTGNIFRIGILSADRRALIEAKKFEENVIQIYSFSKQHVLPSQAPVLLHWLKKNEPATYESIGSVLANKDLVGYFLTGEIKQELGDASGNNFIDLEQQSYRKELFSFFEIEEMFEKLPPLIRSTEKRGKITSEVAKQTGLQVGTPVYGGAFDIEACTLGSGVLDDDLVSMIAGTWSINAYPGDQAAPFEAGLMNSLFENGNGKYLVEASSPTSAGNLELMLKMLFMDEVNNAKNNQRSIYDELEIFLEHTDASFAKLVFFPFLYGSNTDLDASGAFIGMNNKTTKSEMIRAVYEGIVFAHKQHLESLPLIPKFIRLSGGAANSAAWCQMFADILGYSVETITASELGGLGGAMICAVGQKEYEDFAEASQQMVKVKQRFTPSASNGAQYLEKYQIYADFLAALNGKWRKLQLFQREGEE